MSITRGFEQYLQRYAEAESKQALALFNNSAGFAEVIIIPVYDEDTGFLENVLAEFHTNTKVCANIPSLIILVMNAPENNSGEHESAKRTCVLLSKLRTQYPTIAATQDATMSLHRHHLFSQIQILCIDRCSQDRRIPRNQGVGLARKIGNDIASQLIASGVLKTKWLHNTDADAQLPPNYPSLPGDINASAVCWPYNHIPPTPSLATATAIYELSLHYYVNGLRWAGSPYAYHTVGSTLSIDALSYIQVRGFPKLSAAEDFYILNKLNKIRGVTTHSGSTIKLSGRLSTRTPFGTGSGISNLLDHEPTKAAIFYHPRIFHLLKSWLRAIPQLYAYQEPRSDTILTLLNDQMLPLPEVHWIVAALESLNINSAWRHALKQSRSEQIFLRHMNTWFDGFRTLKFIHHLREAALASVPFSGNLLKQEFMLSEDSTWEANSIQKFESLLFEQKNELLPNS